MPIYVYQTTDPARPRRQFEIRQSMRDEPLRFDPETGEPVQRVISGGYGLLQKKSGAPAAPGGGGSCHGGGCGCH